MLNPGTSKGLNSTGPQTDPTRRGQGDATMARPKGPSKKRRVWRWLLTIVGLLVVLAALAPTLLSTGPGRRAIAAAVNGQIRGTVQLDDLSLGWFSRCSAGGVSVSDSRGRPVLSVAQVHWDRGLWRALWAGQDFGELTVESPRAHLFANPDGTVSLQEAFEPRTPRAKSSSAGEPSRASVVVTWGKGQARAIQPDGRELQAVSEAAGSLTIKSMNDIQVKLTAMLAGGGKLDASASLTGFNDPARGALEFSLDKASGQLQVRTEPAVDLQPVFAFFRPADQPAGQGAGTLSLNADAQLADGKGSASYSIRVAGVMVAANKPSAIGPDLKPLDGELKGELTYENGTLNATSDLAAGRLGAVKTQLRYATAGGKKPAGLSADTLLAALTEGRSLELPDFSLSVNGKLDLAAAAESVPGLLPLRKDVRVTAGSLELNDIKVSGGERPAADGAVKLTLTTQRPGQPPKVMDPLEAKFKLTSDEKARLHLEQAEAKASFADLNVHGALPQLDGRFRADLAGARGQLNEFLDLDNVVMAGTVAGTLQAGEDTTGGQPPSAVPGPNKASRIKLALGVDLNNVAYGAAAKASGGSPARAEAPPPDSYTGRFEWAGGVQRDPDKSRIALEGVGAVVRLVRTSPGAKGPEQFDVLGGDKFTVKYDLAYDLTARNLAVSEFQVDSKLLALTIDKGGTIDDLTGKCLLNLSGSYRLDWPEAMALLKRLSPDAARQLALAGDSASKITLSGPLSNPEVATQARLTDVSGGGDVDWHAGSKLCGMVLGDAQFTPSLKGGRVVVPAKSTSANGGKLSLGCYIDLTGRDPMAGPDKDPVLVIDGELNVLDKVELNQEVGRELLSRVLPLFGDLSKLEGKVSLRLKDVHVPLSGRITKVGRGSGRLDLSDVHLAPAGEFGRLFKLLGVAAAEAEKHVVTVSAFDFQLLDGGLSFQGLTLAFAPPVGLDLKFSGVIKFDDSVNIVMSVPVTPSLLGGLGVLGPVAQYAKALEGVRVDIPLSGTRFKTSMDLAKVNPKPLIEEAIKKLGKLPSPGQELPLPKVGPLPSLPKLPPGPPLPKLPNL